MHFSRFFLLLMLCASVFSTASFNQTALIGFIHSKQLADNSFGGWSPYTSFAILGLSSVEGNSSSVLNAKAFLESSLNDPNSFMWSESDEIGAALYSIQNYSLSNKTAIEQRLSTMQLSSGGFKGWWTEAGIVEDSVDTAWAVLGHSSLNDSQKQNALNYLLSMQNADGSFNHSSTISSTSISALAPDKTSTTALALLALKKLGLTAANSTVWNAISFLKSSAESCFEGSYSSAVSAILFSEFNETEYAGSAINQLKTLQNLSSGGFSDVHRFSTESNPIDSGIALYVISLNYSSNATCTPANSTPVLSASISSPVVNGSSVSIQLNSTKPLQMASLQLTYPNSSITSLALVNSSGNKSFETLFNDSEKIGNYSLLFTAYYMNNSYAIPSNFISSIPVQVIVAASLPNSTTLTKCVTIANQSNGESVVRQAFASEWATFSFGNLLTKLLDVGCTSADPFCQSSCDLYWNFFTPNASQPSQWLLSNVGLGEFRVENQSVIGLVWSNNFSRKPPQVNYSEVCVNAVSSISSEQDLLACPSPTLTPTPTPSGGQQTITLSIDFPQNSNKQDLVFSKTLSSCSKALDCFNSVASVGCQNTQAIGGLSCAGVSQTCYINSVNDVVADYTKEQAWWGFYVNGQLASQGVSCYPPKAGDRLELKYTVGNEPPGEKPVKPSQIPISFQSSSSTPTPLIAPSPSSTPSQTNQNQMTSSFIFSPSTPYVGSLELKFELLFDDYVSGKIFIEPKPDEVRNGSIIAVWKNVSASKQKPFTVTINSTLQQNASINAVFKPIEKNQNQQKQNPTIFESQANQFDTLQKENSENTLNQPAAQTGLATADSTNLTPIGIVILIALTGIAFYFRSIFKK